MYYHEKWERYPWEHSIIPSFYSPSLIPLSAIPPTPSYSFTFSPHYPSIYISILLASSIFPSYIIPLYYFHSPFLILSLLSLPNYTSFSNTANIIQHYNYPCLNYPYLNYPYLYYPYLYYPYLYFPTSIILLLLSLYYPSLNLFPSLYIFIPLSVFPLAIYSFLYFPSLYNNPLYFAGDL
jgi:hypothetical protein